MAFEVGGGAGILLGIGSSAIVSVLWNWSEDSRCRELLNDFACRSLRVPRLRAGMKERTQVRLASFARSEAFAHSASLRM